MTNASKEAAGYWGAEAVKSLGFPIVVCMVLLYAGNNIIAEYQSQIKEDRVYIQGELKRQSEESLKALGAVQSVITNNTAALERNTAATMRLETLENKRRSE